MLFGSGSADDGGDGSDDGADMVAGVTQMYVYHWWHDLTMKECWYRRISIFT